MLHDMSKKSVDSHVRAGDYFGTLATILSLLSEPVISQKLGRKKEVRMLQRLRDDLVYLQKHYVIMQNAPMISKEALDEFKSIWKKEFGEEISDAKALDEATNLLTLMNAVYRPIKKEWLDEFNKKYRNENRRPPNA